MADAAATLLELWGNLALRLADRAAADPAAANRLDWLRQSVIAPFRPVDGALSLTWIGQALALSAWLAETRLENSPARPSWGRFAEQASDLRRRLDESSRGRKVAKGATDFTGELQVFLGQCQAAFAGLAKSNPDPPPDPSGDELSARIAGAIDRMPPACPPLQLLLFRQLLVNQDFERYAELLPRAQKYLTERHAKWSADLGKATKDWPAEGREAVLLVRALLHEMDEVKAGPSAWSELAVLLREFLTPLGLHGELIRDPKNPRTWFETPKEADIPEPVVERFGLAARKPPGGWIGFPRGRLVVPIPVAVSPWKEAADTLSTLAAAQDWLSPLVPMLRALCEIDPEQSPEVRRALGDLLDALAELANTLAIPPDGDVTLQRLLAAIRQWAEVAGLDVLPTCWRFDQRPSVEQLADGEGERAYTFHPTQPAGTIAEVRRFGLAKGAKVASPYAVTISAGPRPEGFAELRAVVGKPADELESDVASRLDGWSEASLKGALDVVAVQFYVDFYNSLADAWRERSPDRANAFTGQLFFFLQHSLQLFPFSPQAYQDFPDGWLQRVGGRGMVSGRVRRVIRPGLQDEQNQLRLPALVEVE